MAGKSRLGKGLGALFPALPNGPVASDRSSDAQMHNNGDDEVGGTNNAMITPQVKLNNTDQGRTIRHQSNSTADDNERKLVSEGNQHSSPTSHKTSTTAKTKRTVSKQTEQHQEIHSGRKTPSSHAKNNMKPVAQSSDLGTAVKEKSSVPHDSETKSDQTSVSRETLANESGRSRNDAAFEGPQKRGEATGRSVRGRIPHLEQMTHPSDLFFKDSASATVQATATGRRQNQVNSSGQEPKEALDTAVAHPSTNVEVLGKVSDEAETVVGATRKVVGQMKGSKAKRDKSSDNNDQSRTISSLSGTLAAENDVKTKPTINSSDLKSELEPIQGGYLAELKLDQIGPNLFQPRTVFDDDELQELADSIREVGILQPIVVRRRPKGQVIVLRSGKNRLPDQRVYVGSKSSDRMSTVLEDDEQRRQTDVNKSAPVLPGKGQTNEFADTEYEIIMGERRWRASFLAKIDTIPAIVKTTADDDMLRDALLENLHRAALNPLEEAAAYQQMIDEFGLTQAELSKSIAKSRPQIANTLRLLNLPASVQRNVAAGVLSAGHARALLGLPDQEEMSSLAKRIISKGLSVRSTEELVAMKAKNQNQATRTKSKKTNPWQQSPLQESLENRFDTKVSIKGTSEHGRIEIVFSSPEDMDRIMGLLIPSQNSQSCDWV